MATTNRIYIVRQLGCDAAGNQVKPRLVRAPNATQAWRRVAEELITVDLASQDELVELAGSGVKVEEATAPTP